MRRNSLIPALLLPAILQAQAPDKTVNELKAFFVANCVKCHGTDGSALGPEGKKLGGFDFTDAKAAAKETDGDMLKTIRKGLFFGIKMPSFKEKLSEADAQLLVKEILRKAEKGKVIAPSE
jgi:mono/diheme cytochrome c family protein